MNSLLEIGKIWLALLLARLAPRRLRTRLCRLAYNYQSRQNRGLDWVIDYRPVPGIGLKMLLNTKEFVGWNILFLGQYEPDTNLILQQKIKEGMVAVEAGAHIGSETLLMAALVGFTGKVYAFEPNPTVMKHLAINVLLNDFSERVALSDIALGEAEGVVNFYVNKEHTANQGQSSKYAFDGERSEIQVHQQTLDEWMLANQVPRLDFLKMDVQGAELDILNGAAGTIARFRPLIFAEADDTAQSDSAHNLKDLHQKLIFFDYRVHLVLPNGTLREIAPPDLPVGNWLAISV